MYVAVSHDAELISRDLLTQAYRNLLSVQLTIDFWDAGLLLKIWTDNAHMLYLSVGSSYMVGDANR